PLHRGPALLTKRHSLQQAQNVAQFQRASVTWITLGGGRAAWQRCRGEDSASAPRCERVVRTRWCPISLGTDWRSSARRRTARQHDHAGPDLDAGVEVRDVLVGQPDAARRYEGADGRGLVGAMDAVERLAQVERAGAERVAGTAGHEARQI